MERHEKYRLRRKALGSQAEVAAKLGLSRDTLIQRESGKTRVIEEHELALLLLEIEADGWKIRGDRL